MISRLALIGLLGCGTESEKPAKESPSQEEHEAVSSLVQTESFTIETTEPVSATDASPVQPTRHVQTPAPLDATPAIESALLRLGAVVDEHASDPANAWAIGHGLLARGETFALADGTPALPYLFAEYAQVTTIGEQAVIHFPRHRNQVRIEPHAELMLKVLTEINVAPQTPVTVQGHALTVGDLYRGSLHRTYLVPATNHSSFASTNDMPWALQALASWSPPHLKWTAEDGTQMNLDDLTTFTVTVLVHETQFMFEAMQAQATFEKRGQGIFQYTCGGAHLLQGTALAVARGNGSDLARKAITAQIPLLFYRIPKELEIYDAAMRAAPEHADQLLLQRLKFAGHALESLHKMAAFGFYRPSESQVKTLDGLAQQIVLTTDTLENRGVLSEPKLLMEQDEQLYLDLIGDSAHAIHGLNLALGRRSVHF